MVTIPSAYIVVSLYTHAHTLYKEQSGMFMATMTDTKPMI
jgi:hypothetical protein